MLPLSVIALAFAASAASSSPVPEPELQLLTVLHKHGDRSPMRSYPNDPHGSESNWNNGFGQLTNEGKRQMWALGKWVRESYGDFLPVTYDDRDVYARSTDTTRDLMSAYLLLSGLYEPTGPDVWSEEVRWQPIPVHATPLPEEFTLMSVRDCPRLDRLTTELMASDYVRNAFADFSKDTEVISKMAGFDGNHIVESIWLYDVFFSQAAHGYPLPEWANSYYPQPLADMLAFLFRLHAHDEPLQRLTCGPLLKEVLSSIDDKIAGNSTHRYRQYTGHDAMIIDFLRCLKVDDEKIVLPYVAAIILELRERGSDHFLAVRYKLEDEVRSLTVPGCEELCSLEKFRELVKAVVPDDWERECREGR